MSYRFADYHSEAVTFVTNSTEKEFQSAKQDFVKLYQTYMKVVYEREELVAGFLKLLEPFRAEPILDCACGVGFLTLDLVEHGFPITCTDGSELMLSGFRQDASDRHLTVVAEHVNWLDLGERFPQKFSLVLCRGNSLVYGKSWFDGGKSVARAEEIGSFLKSMGAALRDGGKLYIDLPKNEDAQDEQVHLFQHPIVEIDGEEIEIQEEVRTDPNESCRIWTPTVRIGDSVSTFTRYSTYLPHETFFELLREAGFESVEQVHVSGEREHLAQFLCTKRAC